MPPKAAPTADDKPVTHGEIKALLLWPLRSTATFLAVLSIIVAVGGWGWVRYTASATASVDALRLTSQAADEKITAKVDVLDGKVDTIMTLVGGKSPQKNTDQASR